MGAMVRCPRLEEERRGEADKKAGWREELAGCEARLENPRRPPSPPLLHLQLQQNLNYHFSSRATAPRQILLDK